MRIWKDPHGALVDDERLLAYVSAHGSLSAAVESGDFELLFDSNSERDNQSRDRQQAQCPTRRKRLADYLGEKAAR